MSLVTKVLSTLGGVAPVQQAAHAPLPVTVPTPPGSLPEKCAFAKIQPATDVSPEKKDAPSISDEKQAARDALQTEPVPETKVNLRRSASEVSLAYSEHDGCHLSKH